MLLQTLIKTYVNCTVMQQPIIPNVWLSINLMFCSDSYGDYSNISDWIFEQSSIVYIFIINTHFNMSEYYKSISAHSGKFHTVLKTISFSFKHILIICCIIETRYF